MRFAILCTARSGSTWLHTLLNSHPNIHSEGETVLLHHNLNPGQSFQDFAYSAYPLVIRSVGLKVFYDDDLYQEALNSIKKDEGVRIIHLIRKDLTGQFISFQKAAASGEWSFHKDSLSSKLRIDTNALQEYHKRQKLLREQIKLDFKNHAFMEITYEDLVKETGRVTIEIQKFLEIKQKKLFSLLKKQAIKPLKSEVENWNELVDKGFI